MYKTKKPVDWKCCGTCQYWTGSQNPDSLGWNVEFYEDETARCAGGVFRGSEQAGKSYCGNWTPRFEKKF